MAGFVGACPPLISAPVLPEHGRRPLTARPRGAGRGFGREAGGRGRGRGSLTLVGGQLTKDAPAPAPVRGPGFCGTYYTDRIKDEMITNPSAYFSAITVVLGFLLVFRTQVLLRVPHHPSTPCSAVCRSHLIFTPGALRPRRAHARHSAAPAPPLRQEPSWSTAPVVDQSIEATARQPRSYP